jgi:alpha-ribazole phosphatase
MKLWLIRHTRPAIGEGICYGASDIGLPDTFPADAQALLAAVDSQPETVYSSPLQRCARLAALLATRLASRNTAPVLDARLQEMNFGRWELQPWSSLDRDELDRWADRPLDWRAPGGETARELWLRACAFIEELQASGLSSACVVSHGGVLRMLCARLWNQPPESALEVAIPFGGALSIGWNAGERDARLLSLQGCNDADLPSWMRGAMAAAGGAEPLARSSMTPPTVAP